MLRIECRGRSSEENDTQKKDDIQLDTKDEMVK